MLGRVCVNWREILLNLGTPVVETLIANEFNEIVVFQKDENGFYVVIESKGVIPTKSVYESENEIKSEFPDMNLIRVTSSIYYLTSEEHPDMEIFKRIENLSERMRSIESMESRITRHMYQLQGMDTVISSLFEPIPTEILLSMVMDALSELFVTSVALYRYVDGEYVMFTSLGSEEFPDSLPGELRSLAKLAGVGRAENLLGEKGLLMAISEETENVYILYLKRAEPFAPEERALLESIAKIISRTREYMKSRERIEDLDKLLNQSRFVVESLGEFSQKLLSIHSVSDLESILVDMFREMLQVDWVAIYARSDNRMSLLGSVSVTSSRYFPNELRILEDPPRMYRGKPDQYISGHPRDTWLIASMRPKDIGEYVILFGPPITEEIVLGDVFEVYVEIALSSAEKAFESIRLYEEVRERERKITKLHSSLESVASFVREIRRSREPSEVYELLFEYASKNLGVSGMIVRVGGLEMNLGKPGSEILSIEIQEGGEILGSVDYYKPERFNDVDVSVLKALTEGVLSALREMYLMLPSQPVVHSEEVMLRFLREKAILHGMSEEKLRFFRIRDFDSPEVLKDYGVAVVENGDAIIATEFKPEDLIERGFKIEEV